MEVISTAPLDQKGDPNVYYTDIYLLVGCLLLASCSSLDKHDAGSVTLFVIKRVTQRKT